MYNVKDLASSILQHYGIEGKLIELYGEIDQNYRFDCDDGKRYLVKVSPAGTDPEYLLMQIAIGEEIAKSNDHPLIPRMIPTLSGEPLIQTNIGSENVLLRIQSWVAGKLMSDCKPIQDKTLFSIGIGLGKITSILSSFKYEYENSQIKWAPTHLNHENIQVENFDQEIVKVIKKQLELFKEDISSELDQLRKSWIYHDGNDHNLLLELNESNIYQLSGVIDFGDAIYSQTINDVAVAIAYAAMDKNDPLQSACELLRGYHLEFPMQEDELNVLYYLISARLIISLNFAANNVKSNQDNKYLQISTRPARDLLIKWSKIHPDYAKFAFRNACGFDSVPYVSDLVTWLKKSNPSPLFDLDKKERHLDLSIGSIMLGNAENYIDDSKFEKRIKQIIDFDSEFGIGGYLETRPFYTTDAYTETSNEGPEWRTVHLGLDVWTYEGTVVRAPLDGIVHSYNNNEGERNYGPTIILEHQSDTGIPFYTLYGHLAEASLAGIERQQKIKKGQIFCALGNSSENGGWPPHLHFQIISDLLNFRGDFPGVCYHHSIDVWKSICPDPSLIVNIKQNAPSENLREGLFKKRAKFLPPNLSISYRNPLFIERGFKQFLYDHTGRRYLDTVNNVAHVGHEHPDVVAAGKSQMEVLNTNTRYLHENIVALAEKLSGKFPDPLQVCFFVNSGSEATELALRLAKTYTGNKGMVVMDVGYHGNTSGSIEVSSYKFDRKGGKGASDHIRKAPLPDTYRGLYSGEGAGIKYANHVKAEADSLANSEFGLSGFICESILSCGGQIVLPDEFLKKSIEFVHQAGGLVISDEVQVGFGRMGSKYWGFELYGDIVPDIVTMGKPFGNGHPLGAVITTVEIAEAFANGMEYFNTFGGNPVSAAIGKSVMETIEHEGLQENALKMGSFLINELNLLQKTYPVIGDVRGHGLFLGFELMDDPVNKIPSKAKASYLVNRMRERGVLMSTDGFDENVIKIKPPICIEKHDMDLLLGLLEEVLEEDYMQI